VSYLRHSELMDVYDATNVWSLRDLGSSLTGVFTAMKESPSKVLYFVPMGLLLSAILVVTDILSLRDRRDSLTIVAA
jgi:hypothetical protein